MIYVKGKINDTVEIQVEIHEDNVFCACLGCWREVRVNLAELFSGESDGAAFYCQDCGKDIKKGRVFQ